MRLLWVLSTLHSRQLLPVGWFFRKDDEHPVSCKQQDPATSSPWHHQFPRRHWKYWPGLPLSWCSFTNGSQFLPSRDSNCYKSFCSSCLEAKPHTIQKKGWFHGKRKWLPRKHREATKRNRQSIVGSSAVSPYIYLRSSVINVFHEKEHVSYEWPLISEHLRII